MHTFVICAYKESPFLIKCIESCKNQTSVLNNNSKIIMYTSTPNEYIKKISVQYGIPLFIKEGGSIGKDWNNALSVVETRYATIIHQDDLYLSNYGEKILNSFEENNNLNIVFCDYEEIDEQDNIRERNVNLKIKTFGLHLLSLLPYKKYQRRIYAFGNFICCPAVSYDLDRLKDFSFNESLRMAVDWDAWERIMKRHGEILYIPERLMYHRIHSESETTVNTVSKTREAEEYELYQRYWGKTIAKLLMKYYVNNQKSNQL
ncbi:MULTISPECIES: glycosyltransferase family 2 protein [Enterococcus]|uniref:Glycosyltransferase n=1 Tax=Enterococcus casseliflavus TaxID=37734 RepID=A0ABD6Z138_ENTCA|nr:glycosyltransferase family 2 protein [Enterococcus casseliflavus]EOH79096.1 hypothetical protein UAM_02620 [Enterococcus casseliflavus ATCC 49996]EOU09098.1 hypothetical protein I582_02262 [Enterococcus casseliflavus ATCC 49996]MBE9879288.1 glycosyltransferase family 2 protein [Enterococcus casseliflavus]MDT2972712.1 glycosyltransferase family 2 protein [Enterococcus casseliflavus]QGN30115.1 glycosyltransferase [Enterococcus casseliflavus]